jgi:hypothetical protein
MCKELFITHSATLVWGHGMFREENVPKIYTRHHLVSLVNGLDENLGKEYVPKLSSGQYRHFFPILGKKMSLSCP